jgi:hypothetical protein
VRESEIKKVKNKKWEKEREIEREGELKKNVGEEEGEWERARLKYKK